MEDHDDTKNLFIALTLLILPPAAFLGAGYLLASEARIGWVFWAGVSVATLCFLLVLMFTYKTYEDAFKRLKRKLRPDSAPVKKDGGECRKIR